MRYGLDIANQLGHFSFIEYDIDKTLLHVIYVKRCDVCYCLFVYLIKIEMFLPFYS